MHVAVYDLEAVFRHDSLLQSKTPTKFAPTSVKLMTLAPICFSTPYGATLWADSSDLRECS
jgi:hypothetical protein